MPESSDPLGGWDGGERPTGSPDPAAGGGYAWYGSGSGSAEPPTGPTAEDAGAPGGWAGTGSVPADTGSVPADTGSVPADTGWAAPPPLASGAVDVTPTEPDLLSGGGQPPRRRSLALIAGSVLAVVALVLAGAGVKKLVRTADGNGVAPATVVPASAFAYLQLNLNPSASQRLAILDATRRIPGSPTKGADADSLRDTLFRALLKDTPADYDADLKPWLGDSAGAAAFPDSSGHPQTLVVAAVKDQDAAMTTLNRMQRAHQGVYGFRGDYVLIAQSEPVLHDAQAALGKGALADAATFKADLGTLPDDELVTGWADMAKASAAGTRMLRDHGCLGSGEMSAGCPISPLRPLLSAEGSGTRTGRLVLGARMATGYVDLQVRSRDASQHVRGTDVSGMMGGLPADTAVAIGVGSPDKALASDSLRRGLLLLAMLPAEGAGSGSFDEGFIESTSSEQGTSASSPAERRLVDQIEKATGLSFPDDFATVLGDRAALALSPVRDSGDPYLGVISHPSDLDQARTLAQRMLDRMRGGSSDQVLLRTEGDELVFAPTDAYARQMTGGGLGESSRYRTAMGDMSGAWLGAYAVPRLVDKEESLAPVDAVGIVGRTDGSDTVLQVRVVMR